MTQPDLEPYHLFEVRALGAAREIHRDNPRQGFRLRELGARMGEPYRMGDAGYERLRDWVEKQDDAGPFPDLTAILEGFAPVPMLPTLSKVEHDHWIYVGGNIDEGLSETAKIAAAVDRQAFWLGGIFEPAEIAVEIGREDESGRRAIRRVLEESDRYTRASDREGERRFWLLNAAERSHVPVPGRHLRMDLRLTVAKSERGRRVEEALSLRLQRIGVALAEARTLAGMAPPGIVNGAVGAALDRALGVAEIGAVDAGGRRWRLSDWWTAHVDDCGEEDALASAWSLLEAAGEPRLALGLDVRFWVAAGNAFRVDAAGLSRGSVMPPRHL